MIVEKNLQPQYLRNVAHKIIQIVTDNALDEEGDIIPEINISDEGIDFVAEAINQHVIEQLKEIKTVLGPLLKSAVGEHFTNGVWDEAVSRARSLQINDTCQKP